MFEIPSEDGYVGQVLVLEVFDLVIETRAILGIGSEYLQESSLLDKIVHDRLVVTITGNQECPIKIIIDK